MSFDPRVLPGAGENPFADRTPPYKADLNPYASPVYAQTPAFAGIQGGAQGGLWREGNVLVMHKQAPLPDVCLLSNQPATGRLKRSLRWHHPAVFIALFFNILIYAILAIVLSKTATIHIGISDEWRYRRIRRILVAWAAILIGIGLLGCGIAFVDRNDGLGAGLMIGGIVLLLVGALSGLIGAQLVTAKRITKDYVWLKGVHPGFLDHLPAWPYGVI
jgi:hypothetical protein